MEKVRDNGLVSIMMLSHGEEQYISGAVKSVLAQTYQNWELLFVSEEKNDALKEVLALRAEDAKTLKEKRKTFSSYSYGNSRIKVSYIVGQDEVTPRRNSAL